jgi:response regulator RpfG family c-di-GMP phosphodiesterase
LKADEELKAIPIMAVTAYAAKGDEERIRDAGAEGYVSKPISVIRFVEAVAGLLAAAAEREASEAVAAAAGRSGLSRHLRPHEDPSQREKGAHRNRWRPLRPKLREPAWPAAAYLILASLKSTCLRTTGRTCGS